MDIPLYKLPKRSTVQQFAITVHHVDVDPGITPADVLDPLFWQHMIAPRDVSGNTGRLSLGDEVVVRPTDFSFRLHAEVVAIDPAGHWAALRQISLVEGLPFAIDRTDESGYSYHRDPVQGYRVLLGNDLVASNLPDEAAAISAIEKHKAVNKPKRAA